MSIRTVNTSRKIRRDISLLKEIKKCSDFNEFYPRFHSFSEIGIREIYRILDREATLKDREKVLVKWLVKYRENNLEKDKRFSPLETKSSSVSSDLLKRIVEDYLPDDCSNITNNGERCEKTTRYSTMKNGQKLFMDCSTYCNENLLNEIIQKPPKYIMAGGKKSEILSFLLDLHILDNIFDQSIKIVISTDGEDISPSVPSAPLIRLNYRVPSPPLPMNEDRYYQINESKKGEEVIKEKIIVRYIGREDLPRIIMNFINEKRSQILNEIVQSTAKGIEIKHNDELRLNLKNQLKKKKFTLTVIPKNRLFNTFGDASFAGNQDQYVEFLNENDQKVRFIGKKWTPNQYNTGYSHETML